MNKNYYTILGISKDASEAEVKKAYFSKAKMYHPDVCKDKDAEEKFKEICTAYETLKDSNSRSSYDDFINSNPHSSSKQYNGKSDKHDLNYSILHSLFQSSSNEDSYFFDFLNNNFKTETEIAGAYSYFWLSFWSGGKGTIEMLKHKSATKIFKAFCSNYFIKQMKESLIKEVESDDFQREQVKKMRSSLRRMNESIAERDSSQATYNWMIKLINEDNIFDDESSMYYFLLVSKDVFQLLTKFEEIFDANSSIKAKSHYSDNIIRTRRRGGLFSTIIVFVIIFAVFSFLSKQF